MSTFVQDKFARTAKLMVKISNGVCTLRDGTPLPRMKAGTLAELAVSPWAITDEDERARLLEERRVEFLKKGSSVWARINDRSVPAELEGFCRRRKLWAGNPGVFVEIQIASDLDLFVRGDGRAHLGECECLVPALPDVKSFSLNEAYNHVSEAFEPSRRSHTGNIFDCAFYDDGTRFSPLRKLRDEHIAGNPQVLQPKPSAK